MSTEANTQLLERAKEVCTYFEGTAREDVILRAIEDGNLGKLMIEVKQGEDEIMRQEYQNDDYMTDERAEAMYEEAERKRDELREDGLLGANDVY